MSEHYDAGARAELFFGEWDLTGDSETDAVPDLTLELTRAHAAGRREGIDTLRSDLKMLIRLWWDLGGPASEHCAAQPEALLERARNE